MREELTTALEESKKSKAHYSIFSMSEGDDDEGEYTDPIPYPDLTISPDTGSEPRIEVQVTTVVISD